MFSPDVTKTSLENLTDLIYAETQLHYQSDYTLGKVFRIASDIDPASLDFKDSAVELYLVNQTPPLKLFYYNRYNLVEFVNSENLKSEELSIGEYPTNTYDLIEQINTLLGVKLITSELQNQTYYLYKRTLSIQIKEVSASYLWNPSTVMMNTFFTDSVETFKNALVLETGHPFYIDIGLTLDTNQ